MSETDSFIEEVTEEVRRDRLYALFRRYGWIGALVIIVLVGGAALREYQAAQDRAEAQARGDAILAALAEADGAKRAEALAAIDPGEGNAVAVLALLRADALLAAGDRDGAAAVYDELAGHPDAAYRDLAVLRRVNMGDGPVADRIAALAPLTQPGAPYRAVAMEQQALLQLEAGDTTAAIDALGQLLNEPEATDGQRRRAAQLLVTLGADLSAIAASSLPAGFADGEASNDG